MGIYDGNEKKAQKLKGDFKVPDKRYWWLKLKALADSNEFEKLAKFSKEKRPPIGFGPFVQICIEHGRVGEARQYIARIDKPTQRAEFYMKMEDYELATQDAILAKDSKILYK